MDWNSSAAQEDTDYNIDDCDSTMELATWLRQEQAAEASNIFRQSHERPKSRRLPLSPSCVTGLQRAEHESDKTKAKLTKDSHGSWNFTDVRLNPFGGSSLTVRAF